MSIDVCLHQLGNNTVYSNFVYCNEQSRLQFISTENGSTETCEIERVTTPEQKSYRLPLGEKQLPPTTPSPVESGRCGAARQNRLRQLAIPLGTFLPMKIAATLGSFPVLPPTIDNPSSPENNPPFSGKPSKPIISDLSHA
ncbi:hypothetical protein AVEN_26436-1 [Araneus ventricosus]|uniref:Uncharacterized protein n=1 Tax=Araneus ventricosus TaxID=182803 RepID=A0A4Y2APA6_ARAVE|nr:hypothetical protein AVEN_26436-1 [Araneus ventricosus]